MFDVNKNAIEALQVLKLPARSLGACSGGKFFVSSAGEAYDAFDIGPNRKFRLGGYTKQIGEQNDDRDRSLPDVTEQQDQGHESRDPHQEAPRL